MERASEESKADVNFILDKIGSHPGGSKSDRRIQQIGLYEKITFLDVLFAKVRKVFLVCHRYKLKL